jgi:hypothetical protein
MNVKNVAKLGMALILIISIASKTFALEGVQGKAVFSSAQGKKVITSVALSLSPEGSLETAVIGDVVTVGLLDAGIKVVSSENLIRVRDRLFQEAEKLNEETGKSDSGQQKDSAEKPAKEDQTKQTKKPQPPLDGLAVAKEAGADCIVKITMLAQTIQRNIYDSENKRVIEVRTENRVSLITVNVVDINGNIIKVGSLVYGEPVSVATAATELGKVLVQQLVSK